MTMRTPASSSSAAMARVASSPSTPGMRMSIRTTSGRRARGQADRLVAVGGLADHLDAVLGVQQRPEPGPDQRLVVGQQHPDHWSPLSSRGRRAWTRKPPPGRGPAVSSPPRAATRSRMPRMPLPLPGPVGGHRAAAVVVDPHGQVVGAVADQHGGAGRAGVAGHVGQRLLDDPEGGQVGPGRQGPGQPLDPGAHLQAGRAGPGDQAVQLGQAGGRGPRRRLVALAEHVEHRPQLPKGVVAGLLDGHQGGAGLARLLVHQVQGHAGLHVDQGDVVGEHVVQLAGDAHALLAGPPPGLLGPGPLGGLAALAGGQGHLGDGEDEQQPAEVGGDRGPRWPAGDPVEQGGQGEVGGQADEGGGPGDPPGPAGHRGPEGNDQGQPGRPVGVAEAEVEDVGGHDHGQHHRRGPPPPQQGHRSDGQQQIGQQVQRLAVRLVPGGDGGEAELGRRDQRGHGHVGGPGRGRRCRRGPGPAGREPRWRCA